MKVDMPIVVSVGVENNVTEHLHSDDCIDEEQHPYQQDDIGKSLAKKKCYIIAYQLNFLL